MTSRCPTCVSWVLLASYAILLGVGGVGVWLSVNNFGNEDPLPPTPPPPELETTTTTTTPDPYGNYYSSNEKGTYPPKGYDDYIYATHFYAKASSYAKLYVLMPCVVSVVVAAMVLVGGICSRQFFSSTFSLYSTLGLWALTLTWTIVYQNVVAWNSRMELDSVCWVVGIHVVLMLLLSAQILLCVWELRRQKAGWPTINWRSIFTVEALLVTARLTLTVYTILSLTSSQMFFGYRASDNKHYKNFYGEPRIRYPLVFTFVCCGAACYNAVATIETVLSMLLGKLHTCMTTITSLLSALACVTVAVLNSSIIVRMVISPDYIGLYTMYFAIGLSVTTFLHVIACVGFPTTSRSPPEILNTIINKLVSGIYSLGSGMMSVQLWHPTSPLMKGNSNFCINAISSIFSALSIIIIAVVWDSPMYRAWVSVMVMCANSATLVRTFPPVVMELRFKQAENIPVNQKLIGIALESIFLLVGASGMCGRLYYGGEIFAGVANLLFFVFQIFVIVKLLNIKSQATQSDETEHLSVTEEVASQGKDDELNPSDLLA